MKRFALILALSAPLALSGCVISVGGDDSDGGYSTSANWEKREYNNRKHISNLENNTHFEDVVRKMGVADFTEMYKKDDGTYRVLFYRTQRAMDDGVTTKEECTPLVFKNDRLIGWGDTAYELM